MCEDGFAGDDALYAVCPSIDDNPEMPGTMDQKDSDVRDEVQSKRQKLMDELDIDIPELRKGLEGAEGAGSCAYACKAQASARVDVPTAPEVVPRNLRQCARREGLEVRLSREWVRDLSFSGCSTTTRPIHISAETKQMLQEEFGHILTALRCGVDAPIQGGCHCDDEQRTYRHAPSCLAVSSMVSVCDLSEREDISS